MLPEQRLSAKEPCRWPKSEADGVLPQNRAVRNLFTGPNMIEDVATTVENLRSGDLKLRVRALEAERALDRVQVCHRCRKKTMPSSRKSLALKQSAAQGTCYRPPMFLLVTCSSSFHLCVQQYSRARPSGCTSSLMTPPAELCSVGCARRRSRRR